MSELARGSAFIERICEAQGVDPARVRRVVVDACYNDVVRVYIEMNGTRRLLGVNLSDLDIEVKVLGGHESDLTRIDVPWEVEAK